MIRKVRVLRFINNRLIEDDDYVADEFEVNIYINNKYITSSILSPNNLEDFAYGFAISEGYLNVVDRVEIDKNDICIFGYKKEYRQNKVKISKESLKRAISYKIEPKYWKLTGAFHWATMFKDDLIVFVEDIGRHNAVDKVIGYCYRKGYNLNELILRYSGRINSEIMKKVINTNIPVVISKSPPTYKAIELAKKHNILLIGFLRDDRYNIYTGL
ncbi:formate dehydrogenase accessory sulfurtransferase FdhD [Methanocaldococcus indicus]|uniref:formate dehydrogenase accessory sulfurtransferase FdhD n=1 Tax=Methanocaldococcus indicus TaxID=213231 RepID=UPI003C6D73DC